MTRLYVTRGLPASGKSTAARAMQEKDKTLVNVDRDALRAMLHLGRFSKSNESQVVDIRNAIIHSSLESGRSVIVSDTNLPDRNIVALAELAADFGVPIEVIDLRDVPLSVCLERDAKRPNPVGPKVIYGMWEQHLKPTPPPAYDGAPRAVIVDLDGTVALFDHHRGPFASKGECINDLPNVPVVTLVQGLPADVVRLFTSGRESTPENAEATMRWLVSEGLFDVDRDSLFMRKAGDHRKDAIVKREIYDAEIAGKVEVLMAIDDRSQVVDLWRELGLTCVQVAPGHF